MPRRKKIVLYGSSLFIAGLYESLSAISGLKIKHVEAHEGNNLELVCAAKPDVIIIELGVVSENLTFTLLQKFPGVTIIGLNPESDQLLVLSVKEQTALETTDLVNMIQSSPSSGGE